MTLTKLKCIISNNVCVHAYTDAHNSVKRVFTFVVVGDRVIRQGSYQT